MSPLEAKTRDVLQDRRYAVQHPEPTRWGAVHYEGRLHRCQLSQHKTRSGRLFRLRLRLLRLRQDRATRQRAADEGVFL